MSERPSNAATCQKCGGTAYGYKYIEAAPFTYGVDWLQRRCPDCGYVWREEPMDRKATR